MPTENDDRSTTNGTAKKQNVHLYVLNGKELKYATSVTLGFRGNPADLESAAQKLALAVRGMDPELVKATYLAGKSFGIPYADGSRLKWPKPEGLVAESDGEVTSS